MGARGSRGEGETMVCAERDQSCEPGRAGWGLDRNRKCPSLRAGGAGLPGSHVGVLSLQEVPVGPSGGAGATVGGGGPRRLGPARQHLVEGSTAAVKTSRR